MDSMTDRFDALRLTLEAMTGPNALIVVAGARPLDGSEFVSYGLAGAFAKSGQRVALVTGGRPAHIEAGVDVAPLASLEMPPGRTLVERMAALRSAYTHTIVEVPTLLERAFDTEIARRSDGIVLAIQLGRRVFGRDEEIAEVLERHTIRRLGVVTTKPTDRRSYNASSATRSTIAAAPSAQRI